MKRILLAVVSALGIAPATVLAAITYIGAGTAANGVDGADLSPTLHASTSNGDLGVCIAAQKSGGDHTTITQSGWTKIANDSSSRGDFVVFAKIVTSSSDVATIAFSDNTSTRSTIAQCATFRGTATDLGSIVAHSAWTDNASQMDIAFPSLTVSTANTVVIIGGFKEDDYNGDDIGVVSGFDAEIGQPERTSSQHLGIVWDYDIQTTATNVTGGVFDLASAGSSEGIGFAISLKEALPAPTFSIAPTVSAQDTNDYTLSYTVTSACTFYAVACLKDSTAPTEAQVEAGNCTGDVAAIASASEAVTGADTTVLGGSLTRPIHDVYAFCKNVAGDTNITTLADEMLDAPTGYGPNSLASSYTLLASVSGTSWLADLNASITPDVAAGDVVKITTTTWPSGYAWTQSTDGNGSYTDPNGSRQYLTFDIYDTSAGDWMSGGPATLWFNNSVPAANPDTYSTEEDPLIDGVAMTAVDFKLYCQDGDGDTLTATSSDTGTGTGADKRPAGTTITDGVWAGTPTSTGTTTGTFTITCTDTPGDSDTIDVTWTVYDQVTVPDCDGNTLLECDAELSAVDLYGSYSVSCSDSVAAGLRVSQSPTSGSSANPFSTVSAVISSGSCAARKQRLNMTIKIR